MIAESPKTPQQSTYESIVSTFTQADAQYRIAIEAPGRELATAFSAAREVPQINLQGDDLTKAILLRLKSFMYAQDTIKTTLGKVYATSAADFFVETVLFFLSVSLERLAPPLNCASEKNIIRKQGAMRPDISLWSGNQLIAAIECKTQLGWNRGGWLPDFETREARLRKVFPGAKLFLLVMTGSNWPGFGDDARVGRQFFVLLHDAWPRNFEETSPGLIAHPIETLIAVVLEHFRDSQQSMAPTTEATCTKTSG